MQNHHLVQAHEVGTQALVGEKIKIVLEPLCGGEKIIVWEHCENQKEIFFHSNSECNNNIPPLSKAENHTQQSVLSLCVCVFLPFLSLFVSLPFKALLSLSPMHMNNNLFLFLFACKPKQKLPQLQNYALKKNTQQNQQKFSFSKGFKPFPSHMKPIYL
jgi:hypothetical protein